MAAVPKEYDSISDEEWLVFKAHECLKSDPHAAKAWLMTAKSLFPRNFDIQLEAYNLEKESRNPSDVAKQLEEMFVMFPQEPRLWNEVTELVESLQTESIDDQTIFLRAVFAALPPSLQCNQLVHIADTTTDVLHQCRVMLLVLRRYPEHIPKRGVKLAESLLSAEKYASVTSAVNCYRKYLVCDVLPLLLGCPQLQVSAKYLYRLLQKSIEFFVSYITQPSSSSEQLSSPSPDLKSPSKPAQTYGGNRFRRVSISGLSEKESCILEPWQRLFDLVKAVGRLLQWNVANFFETTSRQSQWQHVYTLYETAPTHIDIGPHFKQILYCTTVLFFHCLLNYVAAVDPNQFIVTSSASPPGQSQNQSPQTVVLIEAFKSGSLDIRTEHRSKKQKTESTPQIHVSSSIATANEIRQNFATAVKCWELLHSSETLEKDLNRLFQHWKAENWTWLKNFEMDVLIYKGYFKEAVSVLHSTQGSNRNVSSALRADLQLACCYYCLANFSKACEMILHIVSVLPSGAEPCTHDIGVTGSGRQLQFLMCSAAEVLPYCIHLMITCFREKAFKTYAADDMSLGHMIVLLQYDWPRYEDLFGGCLNKIRKQGSFTYNIFFNYVINIDILEEFAYLKTPDGGRVNLDILPISTKTLAQSRTVTRGVIKGVKEDFKVTLEKQVTRCNESIERVIRQFLVDERVMLQQNLL